MIKKCLKAFYIGLILLILYAPILLLAVYSFNEVDTLGPMGEFSLKHYIKLFGDPAILEMIVNTVVLALVAAALSTVLGTAGAIGMFYSKRRTRALMNGVNQIPVINAEIVTALALAITFVAIGVGKSYFTLVVGHMVLCTPFVVLSVLPKLRQMDHSLYEAALDLGASPMKALFKVVLPEIVPGIISGFMLAITLSLDDYIITSYCKPSTFSTISTYVYNATMKGNVHTAETLSSFWALTTVIFVIILIVVLVANLTGRKKQENKGVKA